MAADDDGACPVHPAIQLRRRQRRTGEWKAILKACPLCASGLPASEGASANSDGGAATDKNEGRSHDVSEDDDARSVRSSRSHTSHRSSSGRRAGRRHGSRSRGHGSGSGRSSSGRAGSAGRAPSSGRASSRGHERSSSRSESRGRGEHPSRHSAHGLDYDDERSVSSRASRTSHRSAGRNQSRHAEEEHSQHSRELAEEERSVATMDNSESLSHVSSSVSSLSTRPMSNTDAESSPAGVRFHPATKPPDERSVASSAVADADGNESDVSEASENSLSEIMGGEISRDLLSDRKLDTMAHIASAIDAAKNARREVQQQQGVRVPTKGSDRDLENGIGNYNDGYPRGDSPTYSEECATDDEDGSCSSLEEGSRTSSFGDNKRPLPPRGVLRQSSYGPPARQGSHASEEGEPSRRPVHSEHGEALVVYEGPAEESDALRAAHPQQEDVAPPERTDSGGSAQQELYPPPPREPPRQAQQSRWTPDQFRGKMYEGAPVDTPVEDECGQYEQYETQGGRQLTPEQERFRPPPRDPHCYQEPGYAEPGYPEQGYPEQGYPEQGYHEQEYPDQSCYPQEQAHPPPPREDERSIHSQPRQRRSSSRSRGRDDDDQRSVRSHGRDRSAQPGSNGGRSRSQSRTRDRRDSIASQPQKPVGILRQGRHGNPQRRPQEPPSLDGMSHTEQRCAEAPERMQGNRGPPSPYGNNAIPPAPRSGPPAFAPLHLQGAAGGQSTGEYGREMSAPKKLGKGSPSSRDGRGNDASQTEPETDPSISERRGQADRPSEFDDRGRCVSHPHIKLRKKKLLGGWKVLLVNCPDCCIEEMLRMKRDANGASGGRGSAKGARKPKRRSNNDEGSASHGSNQSPPIAQLTIRTHEADTSDVESTGSSASEITFTSGQQSRSSELGSGGSGPHRVTRMPFTDAYGDKGWYTGEVASGSGLPHGRGTMHYCDGRTREGWWSNGLAGSGGGPGGHGGGSRKGARGPPPTHPPPRGDGSVHSRSSANHHPGPPPPQSQPFSPPSHHHNNLPPQQHLPQTNGAVHDMEWTDLRGRFGVYTGETDASGEPHGLGSVRYEDEAGAVEGEWFHGELERRIEGLAVRPAGR
ncbi:hypothetical protein ACHAXT_011382 [Thalassiosira profunda]